nr:endoribonuclease Dicer homolog 3-like [Coffea arabica]
MGSSQNVKNPLKRSFESMNSMAGITSEAMDVDKNQSLMPTSYQVEIFEVAKRRNTIAVLNSGAGKTMIAVMMIKELGQSLRLNGEKKLIIFLAPSVRLVHQQYEVIKCHTELEVEELFGAKGIDDWHKETWEKAINAHDVLVMTPQILLDALRKAFMSLDVVCLMILDECHHATGNHPYTKIMKDFYHDKFRNKPKIFGMTASPVIRKGVTSTIVSGWRISELESLLDSQIYATENRAELEESVPSAKDVRRFYDPPSSNLELEALKAEIERLREKFDAALLDLQCSLPCQYKDINDKTVMLQERLSCDYATILWCLDNLGLICAYEAIKICIETASNVKEECEAFSSEKALLQYNYFLEEVLSTILKSLPQDHEKLLGVGYNSSATICRGYVSSKVCELLEIFRSFGKDTKVSCLIFVERTITAKVLEQLIKRTACLSHFGVSYMTGNNSLVDALAPKAQKETLESFRVGEVNLLFSTDVIEEGIHVPDCMFVVRFDLPKTVHSYVQSRGRACQLGSQFIVMLERGNIRQMDDLFNLIRSEFSMNNTAVSRDPDACVKKSCLLKEKDTYLMKEKNIYVVEATGASVAADSSVSLLQRYCDKLPGDKYFTPKPMYQYLLVGQSYQCQLTLPPTAAFQTMTGPLCRNTLLSKQLVCLEACKKLHQMGALSDHLLPTSEKPSQSSSHPNCKALASGAGTTKRKELHGTTRIRALSGTWGDKLDGFGFYVYKIDFSCKTEQLYSSFVLLLESKLDDDVGNIEVDLYLISKFVKSTVSACGQIHLDTEQVAKAKCFQELFFNGLFGKLFIKLSGERKLLFQTQETLWDPSNMYLLLPVELLINCSEPWRINWGGIESCVSVVEFFKKHAWISAERSESNRKNMLVHRPDPDGSDAESTIIIHLANTSISLNNLKDIVVVAIHTGRIYSIMAAVDNTSAESPFDANSDAEPSSYSSYADYFNKKYGIVLVHPQQPLLLLKQSHSSHNLLVDFRNEGTSRGKKFDGDSRMAVEKPRCYAHMPPELLDSIDVSHDVLRSFYLLPSILYRLESLMLASQLREEIALNSQNIHIASSLILEALTTVKCNESFSMERLELLGDSVLKYVMSCYLFLKHPKKHEGQLSAQRSRAVCNSTLHKLGTDCKLQNYIRDSPFEPRRWTAPGQHSIWPNHCEHGVDTIEVPLDGKFITEDTKVVVGKCCDRGHRWIGSKTISDCVEALIGAYYVDGGLGAAIELMKWLRIDAELEPALVDEAIKVASLHSYDPKAKDIGILEMKLGYEFRVKGLLLEAITHATEQEQDASFCYQRLEFLGDSVLDILITRHLYQTHSDIDPGELTDLRSASVNNDSFALAAVRQKLHLHLQHCSGFLEDQISAYAKTVSDSCNSTKSLQVTKAPKVLGDLVESIAGAILIDTKLNLDEVWRIFKLLLSPIVTPDKLELPPLRELIEWCDSVGYFLKQICTTKGDLVKAELILQLEDNQLVKEGCGPNRKIAKGQAALLLLKDLEERGILSKRPKEEKEYVSCTSLPSSDGICCLKNEGTDLKFNEKQKIIQVNPGPESGDPQGFDSDRLNIPVLPPIDMKKGGPRSSLFALCKRLQWPMPTFHTTERKSRSQMVIGEGSEQRTGFNSFESDITLIIPNSATIVVKGDQRADKKSSFDSAALTMLYELQQQKRIVIRAQ